MCDTDRFETTKHFFPVLRHSLLPRDRDFNNIRRILRRVVRIYTPEQYCELIKRASVQGRFTIQQRVTGGILSFTD